MVITFPLEDYEKRAREGATIIFGKAIDIARKVGVTCETLHVMDKYPAEGIVETAEKQGCDLIVMASHGRRGLSRMFLGSQAAKVVTLSKVPVLICR
jgi:nucleotide-binding universal stress UspA family protein